MRLTKRQAEVATEELLQLLRANPSGLATSEMSGTPMFHGQRTLNLRQIARLLRASGKTRESVGGAGMRTFTVWTLADEDKRPRGRAPFKRVAVPASR